jgi:hypothetical protein
MIGLAEIVAGVRGSLRLLSGDPRAMSDFDCSFSGFWRSFGVVVVMSPAALLSIFADRAFLSAEAPIGRLLAVGLLSYGLGFVAFPLIVAGLARPLGLAERYVPLVVTRNWTTVLGSLPQAVITGLWLLGVLPARTMAFSTLIALGFDLYLSYRAVRVSAAVGPSSASGLVALDLLSALLIDAALTRLAL